MNLNYFSDECCSAGMSAQPGVNSGIFTSPWS